MKKYTISVLNSSLCFLLLWVSPQWSAQQLISGNFESGGNNRSYIGAVPDAPLGDLRLVILFCGAMESASQMELRGFNNYLDNNVMVVYPEPFNSTFGFGNSAGVDDFQMVEDLISAIDSQYFVNLDDICIGGFSNGGIFTYNLICDFNSPASTRPYAFKSFAVVSGAMEAGQANGSNCPIANDVPAIVFHGSQDEVMAYGGGNLIFPVSIATEATEAVVDFWAMEINDCSENPTVTALPDNVTETPVASSVELIEYNCSSAPATRLYRMNGGQHAWPSGNANFDIAQSRNLDINASALIAEFFESTPILSTSEAVLGPNSVSVYPNPFADVLSIATPHLIEHIEIWNRQGQIVHSASNPGASIELKNCSSGLYFLKIETAAGIEVRKIMKQ